jgi:hypothetical protein
MGSWTNPNVQQVTSLFSGGSASGSSSVVNIAPLIPYVPINLVDVSGFASYDINLYGYGLSPGTSDAPCVAEITLQWYDDLVTGIPVFEEDWWFWLGRASLNVSILGQNPLSACGPMHGRYMTVSISIPAASSANMTLQYLNIFGSARQVPYSDWRQNTSFQAVDPNSFGLTTIANGSTSFDNELVSINAFAPTAGLQYMIPCGLYSGPAYFNIELSQTPQNALVLASAEGLVGGQLTPGTGCPGLLVPVAGTGGTQFQGNVLLPRAPCAWVIHVNATTGGTINCMMIAQQAA